MRWGLKKEGRSFLKNRILVDTSIWIEFFRPRSYSGRHVEILLVNNAVWTCGMVIFEIFKGIKSEDEKSTISGIFDILPYAEMTKSLWKRTSELSIHLRKKGLDLPNSDILIATLALEHKLAVFTLDKHFKHIPGLKLYETLS